MAPPARRARAKLAFAPLTEKEFQSQVTDLARLRGFLVYHTFDSRKSVSGFPDLVLVRPPTVIFAELKSQTGRIRPEQAMWLSALEACQTFEVHLWRPSDWDSIQETLSKRGAKY